MSTTKCKCQKCGKDGPEILCRTCRTPFHRACVPSRLSRGSEALFQCGECELSEESAGAISVVPPDQALHSAELDVTMIEAPKTDYAEESELVRSLHRRIKELEQLALANPVKTVNPDQVLRANPIVGGLTSNIKVTGLSENFRQHVELEQSKIASSTLLKPKATKWRNSECAEENYDHVRSASPTLPGFTVSENVNTTRAIILNAITQRQLTREELMNRKLEAELPIFDGNPAHYFVFAAKFRQSTESCGYSQADNLKRLEKCLRGPAKTLVQHLLPYPQHVDKILERLEKHFGQPETLLSNMNVKVNSAAPLKANLSNIQEFFALVEDARNVVELMDMSVPDMTLVKKLVTKLPDVIWREWNRYQRGRAGTIMLFSSFVLDLCDEAMAMRLHKDEMAITPDKKPKLQGKESVLLTESETKPKSAGNKKRQVIKCSFGCSESHYWSKCPVFAAMTVTQRMEAAKTEKRCYYCLAPSHEVSKCFRKSTCKFTGCDEVHHKLLHDDNKPQKQPKQSIEPAKKPELVAMSNVGQPATYFRTVSVIVSANGVAVRTTALMDSGSSVTLIKTELAKRLKLQGEPVDLPLTWANGETKSIKSQKVNVNIYGRELAVYQLTAQTMDQLRLPTSDMDETVVVKEFSGIAPVEAEPPAPAEILIGLDNATLMRTIESRVGSSGRMIASRTPLGWVFEGKVSAGHEQCLFVCSAADESLERLVSEYIEADNFGLIPDEQVKCDSDRNIRALAIMEETTVMRDGRYETGLLWRSDDTTLPCNLEMAKKRQISFERKMQKDVGRWRRVDDLIKKYLDKGYAETLTHGQVTTNRDWYLPIFTVTNANKPDKIRIVWDAAATVAEHSLNSALLTGPDLTAPLVHVLQRFRYGQFAVSGDIEEMFHQISIRKEDRCAQRFLWRGPDDDAVKAYEMRVMTFGATCSPSIAQYIKNRNAERFRGTHPKAVRAIIESHYVDDYLDSCESEDEAVRLAKEVTMIHQAGGFRIHKWISNSRRILEALGDPNPRDETQVRYCEPMVLGLEWSAINDAFCFKFRGAKIAQMIADLDRPTKRELLRVAMSMFDPLGIVSFLTVLPRLLLREVWSAGVEWDAPIPESTCGRLKSWVRCLESLQHIQVPRWHGTLGRDVTLHVFCDASDSALGAAAYIVQRNYNQPGTRSLCLAKCKVAPLKPKSIPRLELDAAMLGVRVFGIVRASSCWRFERTVFWSDARDVLYWIRSRERRYGQYVANRVATILDKTEAGDWRWVPSALNPADFATKWNAGRRDDNIWWRGPDFLDEDDSQWPNSFEPPQTVQEERQVMAVSCAIYHPLIPPVERFSCWTALVRNVATARLFIEVIRRRRTRGPPTSSELFAAEELIYREIQRDIKEAELRKFSSFADENGVSRMRGRTANATHLPYNARFPIILPSGHPVTRLIVKYFHSAGGHSNHQRTLNQLRQNYVFARPRNMLNKVIGDCRMCHVRKTKPICPEMAALPTCRLGVGRRPFTYTGVDLFGPFDVAVGRRREKRWCTLFTCLTTRAVYLELVSSLSARSCIVAIESLVARRGVPAEIRSDNGTNFVAAAKLYRGPDGRRPRWLFNPPGAPHMGGSWERMVGLVKRALLHMQLERTPTEERLRHLLMRAEAIVNARPLTEVPVEADEEEALTPNHFLLGNSVGARCGAELVEEPGETLREVKLEQDRELASFWKRWSNDYLPLISGRTKWTTKRENPTVGDIVFICDGDYRAGWRRGRVVEVYVDSESGQARHVVVATADGKRFRRAVHKIAPIIRKTVD